MTEEERTKYDFTDYLLKKSVIKNLPDHLSCMTDGNNFNLVFFKESMLPILSFRWDRKKIMIEKKFEWDLEALEIATKWIENSHKSYSTKSC